MLKKQITQGQQYTAKVNGKAVTVRVDSIRETSDYKGHAKTTYYVTNLATGRKTIFRSAQKFLCPAPARGSAEHAAQPPSTFEQKLKRLAQQGAAGTITPEQQDKQHAAILQDEHDRRLAAARVQQIEQSYSTERGATEEQRQEAAKLLDALNTDGDLCRCGHCPGEPNAPPAPASTRKPTSKLAARLRQAQDQYASHCVVEAYAGTGKTFTLIVGVAWAYGRSVWSEVEAGIARMIGADPEGFHVVPSEEQQRVWDALAESAAATRTITYCAFNRSIVKEFSEKWGWLVELLKKVDVNLQFATINSLGNSCLYRAYGRLDVTDFHTENMLARQHGQDPRELKRKQPMYVSAVSQLTGLCKLTLAGWSAEQGFAVGNVTDDVLDNLCDHYDVELNGNRSTVYDAVRQMLAASLNVTREVDYNDQNWLPVVANLPIPKVDLVLIDEGQDLNRMKQEFCIRLGRRVVLVGDAKQAIYGFAGADVDSIPRMKAILRVNGPLRLTETRRCGKAIVAEANQYVPDFRAHESNCDGRVDYVKLDNYAELLRDGDMVLCRVNAPLVSQALRRIKAGKKAVIRGRDFGAQLKAFVQRLEAGSVPELIELTEAWASRERDKEERKQRPSESRIVAIGDRVDCICAFAEGSATVNDVLAKMDLVFAGKVCPQCGKHYNESSDECYGCKCRLVTPKGVVYSSVHRAKGLEAKRVFILRLKDAPMPHPMAKLAWERVQEVNLCYVAVTRAIEELYWVTD